MVGGPEWSASGFTRLQSVPSDPYWTATTNAAGPAPASTSTLSGPVFDSQRPSGTGLCVRSGQVYERR